MEITVVTLVEEQMSPWKGDKEVTRQYLVAKVAMEVLVRCWSDDDVVPTSVLSGGDVLIGDVDPTDEDGDIGMDDSTGVSVSLGGEISSGGKKSRESNIGGGYNRKFLEFKTSINRYEGNRMSDLIGGLEFLDSSKRLSGGDVVELTGDEDPTDEDGDTGMGDSIGVLVSLGGEISSGGKKSQESNISGSDITGDRSKTAGRAIIA
ncbi:hypothetical protein Tco_0809855 [Tanacetum coccineum]